ncbi:MAG: flippase [Clostridiales bacterium]|jgi:O-antigen/teichoic acid export membrane protein|nr:flippase [Clostridiales bacterium]HOA34320.1 flippase [Clostridiales bacterium]HOJ36135.1 flippase [Clostridiales bacterium]HOL79866.1 flippase [Clostridiales bacterium]HPP67889.1 flippase [Clostridiales bacterium]
MQYKNKVVKNSAWIIACKVAQSVIGLVVSMFTARYLGPSNYGLINYASSLVAFFVPLMYLGLNSILVQEIVIKPQKEGETLGTALTMSLVSSLFCILGVFAFTTIVNAGEKDTIIVCVLYSILLIFQAVEALQYWFQAKLMSKYTSLTMFAAYIITALYKIFLLASKKSIYWFAVSNALDFAIIAVVLLFIYKRLGTQKLSFSPDTAKLLFSKSRYYIVSSMMVVVFGQIDRVMLKLMIDEKAVGLYSAAVASAGVTYFVFAAIIDSFRPVIFESKKADHASFEKNVSRLYSIIIYFALVQSAGIALFAELVVKILYGEQYLASIPALRIIVWYLAFSHMGSVRNIWILAEGKYKVLWIINLCGALTNVILNLIFIPLWGINGAALTALITQIFTNFILGYIIKPIRRNNTLLLKGLNPNILIELVRKKDV